MNLQPWLGLPSKASKSTLEHTPTPTSTSAAWRRKSALFSLYSLRNPLIHPRWLKMQRAVPVGHRLHHLSGLPVDEVLISVCHVNQASNGKIRDDRKKLVLLEKVAFRKGTLIGPLRI
ncbi:hypothetical protein T265_02795 [Opisthorchis viverrini]|uniref:Uncharacterized protein n=1 Tax=Opisthorchis viverrini TaxID=6198 RepID=A0A075AI19_OPIVI|nr:hypothetical protein T265_02795 [Opisthorchis viverrini]KER30864.1 hypothetical protein T265_02795 [Opisthorchis viverrini]